MLNFQKYSATKILHEINFGHFEATKSCHFDHLSSSKFWIFGNFWDFQVWYFQKMKIQSLQNFENKSFWPSEICQNWFHVKSELNFCYLEGLINSGCMIRIGFFLFLLTIFCSVAASTDLSSLIGIFICEYSTAI